MTADQFHAALTLAIVFDLLFYGGLLFLGSAVISWIDEYRWAGRSADRPADKPHYLRATWWIGSVGIVMIVASAAIFFGAAALA